jgi:heptosyltransferase-2
MSTRTLVVAPQWIGDAVMSQPLLLQLAARGEEISVAALPWVAPVYRAMPQVREVLEWPFAHGRLDWSKRRGIAAGLRGRFDVAYVLPNSLKSALIPFLARIPQRIGYSGESRIGLLNKRLPNPKGRPPMVAFYAALSGDPVAEGTMPRLQFDAATLERATASVDLTAVAYWAFAPGAEYGPAKCWPASHYAELARELHASDGSPVALIGSGKEAALCQQIADAAPDACRVLAGRTSLIDAMALIAASRGLVSNDSGLMHVAAAFGLPQVAVFGSTSPEHTPPLNTRGRARVLWLKDELDLDCMPCFERTCRYGHYRCLTAVTPARVLSALAEADAHA